MKQFPYVELDILPQYDIEEDLFTFADLVAEIVESGPVHLGRTNTSIEHAEGAAEELALEMVFEPKQLLASHMEVEQAYQKYLRLLEEK